MSTHVHECGIEADHKVCVCVVCGERYPNKENSCSKGEQLDNYRVEFDYAAESPTRALIYVLGVIEDPNAREIPLQWAVTNLRTGEKHNFTYTLAKLDEIARAQIKEMFGRISKPAH